MSIKIIHNEPIKLDIPKFLCDDNPIGKHLNDSWLPLINCYSFFCVIGRPGQGKTSLAISLMTQKKPKIFKKCFHHNIIIMPSNSIASLKNNPFEKLQDVYNELNDDTINEIYNKIQSYSTNDEKTILFIDDMTADLKKTKFIIDTLKRIIFNRRHLKTVIIITAQSYVNLPLDVRKNINNLILFKPSKKEMGIIFDELMETKKDKWPDIMRCVYNEPHNFLFLNVPNQRMFKNWDELIIKDDDSDDEIEITK